MLNGAIHTTLLINGKTAEPLKTGKPNVFKVKVGEHYRVIQGEVEEKRLADNVIVKKSGDDLQLQFADGTQVTLEKYYDECKAASSCDLTLPGQDGGSYTIGADSASGAALGDGSILVYAHGTHDMLMSMAQGNAALYSTLASLQGAEISYNPTASISAGSGLLGALGALGGGVVLAAMASSGGATPASSNAPAVTPDTTPPSAPTITLASDSGVAADSITNVGTVNVAGLEAGATWQYSTNGGTSWTTGSGSSFTLSGDGAKSVTVHQTDAAGNVSVASSALAFTLDATAPGIQSLAAHSVSKTIDITYDDSLDATHLPPATAFSVTTGGAANPVASVSVAGSVMTLTLANAFAAGAVNVSYIDPTAGDDVNAIEDLAGNDAVSFASGVVADGYVRGAAVYIDTNHNGTADPGTDYFVGTTDANGNFFIPGGAPGGSIIAIGGVNIDTGVPNTMPLKAPEGSTTINPLTTLVEAVVQASGGITSAASAAAMVAANLGLTVPVGQTLLGYDPIAAGDLTAQKAAAQVATIITLAENAVAGAGSAVVSNLVTELNNASSSGSTLNLADSATLDSMLGNSLSGASVQVQSAIADASAAIGNAASLSAVATAQSQALDTIAAQAPGLSVAANTNDSTPSVRVSFNTSATDGTAAVVGDALVLQDGGLQIGTAATLTAGDVAAGYKDLTANVLTEGSHSLSATLTDQAGNTSAASVAALVNVDTQAPSAPTLHAVATDDLIGSNEHASVISGSAEANATVTLSVGANNHTMTAGNSGAWSYTLTAADITAMGQGPEALSATATDAAGNVSAAGTRAISVDTVAPTIIAVVTGADDNVTPVTGNITAGGTTNDNTLGLSGTLSATLGTGEAVYVYDGATRLGEAAVASSTWTFSTASLANATHSFSARVEDAAGNLGAGSSPYSVTVNATVPTATATITAVTDDVAQVTGTIASAGLTNDSTPVLSGAIVGTLGTDIVVIYDGASRLGPANVAGSNWSYAPATLSSGNHSFTAVIESAGGNQGAAGSAYAIVVDTTAPLAPSINTVAVDNVINSAEQTAVISGSAEAGSTLELSIGGNTRSVSTNGSGTWSYTLTPADIGAMGQGAETLSATATDVAGNPSAPGTRLISVDTVAPTTTINAVAGDNAVNASELASGVTVTGNSEAGAQIALTLGSGNIRSVTADGSTGAWTYTLNIADIKAMGQGNETLSATATDAAGNTGAAGSRAISIDSVAPALTSFSLAAASDSGAVGDGKSNVATPSIEFTAENGSTLEVNQSQGAGYVAAGTGTGSAQTLLMPTAFASDGSYTISLRATDAAGNTTVRSGNYVLDRAALNSTSITGVTDDVGTIQGLVPNNGSTDDTVLIINGSAEAYASVTVFDNVTKLGAAVIANETGAWSFTTPTLSSGVTYAFNAKAADASGNTGKASTSQTVTIDTLAPTLAISSNVAVVKAGETATITFTFSEAPIGFADADITTTGGTLGLLSGTGLTRSATFTPTPGMASGNASITVASATFTDSAGNTGGAGTTPSINIDTVAPTLTIISNVATVKAGETASITFTFSEDPGSSFAAGDITTTGGTLGALSGTGLTRSATFTPTPGLASGNASITVASATYTDAAGNGGAAATTPTIAMDTLAPTLAITSNVSAVKAGETATITFTFSEDPGSSFVWNGSTGDVVVSGGTLGAIGGTGLTRSATFTPTPDVASGNASITVASTTYTDAAGNTGGAGTTPSISIDTLVPTLTITSNVAAVKAGEAATITFTFSEDPGSSFVWDGSAGDVVVSGGSLSSISGSGLTRTATFTPTPGLVSGNASITVASATYTDAAGNAGAAGTTPTIAIDTLAPTLAITSNVAAMKAGETATITFSFSEDPGNSFAAGDITTTGGTLGAISGSGLTRTATFTPTADLASGSASITVAASSYTDAAGNAGAAGTTPTIAIDTLTPMLTISSNVAAVKAGEAAIITFTFSEDPGSSFVWNGSTGDLVVSGGTLGAISGTGLTRTATFTPTPGLASGNASITVASATYTDAAGNTGGAGTTPSISIDTLAPTLAITSNVAAMKAGETATITFSFSEDPGNSFAAGDITTTGGTLGAISGSGLTRTATFTPTPGLASGNASITVASATYTDAAGNMGGAGSTPSISIDTLAPTLAISSNVAAVKAGETATITFIFSEAPIGFADEDITTTGGTLGAISGTGLTRSATFTPTPGLASGSASITVAASSYTDAAGNAGAAGSTPSISIDTLAPTLTITSNVAAVKAGETATITFTFSEDPGSSFVWDGSAGDVVVSGGTLSAVSGTGLTRTATFTPTAGLASSSASITVAASSYADAAGNAGAAGTTPTTAIDTLAPSLAISSNVAAVKAGETATITFTFSEDPGNSFADGDITTTGGTLGATSGTGLTRTATFTPTPSLASGNASITVASATYTDAAGNAGGAGSTPSISIDTLAPTLTISSNVAAVKIGETATITFTFSEAPVGFMDADISTTGGTLGAIGGTGLTRSATFTPTPDVASGNASITVASATYTDAAGNTGGAGTTPSISIDTLAPTLAITSNVVAVKAGETATITFTFSEDPGSSFVWDGSTGDVVVSGGTLSAVSGTGLTRTAVFTPTAGLASGNASITVASATYTDAAGNAGGAGSSPVLSIDTLAPTLAITSNVATLKSGESATITFTFSEDPGSSFAAGDITTTGGTLGAISGSGLTRFATFTPTPGLASGNASITVAASSYTDTAGNAGAAGTTPTIAMDTLAPTLAISSNVAKVKAGETATITFTFSEAPIGFADADITTTGGTLSAISGTGLTRSAVFTPTPGMASGNASITVANATYTDAAGNTGGAGTTPSIRIDTVAPTLAISSDVSTLKAGDTATITFTFSEDPGNTFAWDGSAGDVVVSGGTLSAIGGSGLWRVASFTPTPGLASGSASITVASATYTDAAGNTGSAGTTPSISIDTLAPTLVITSDRSVFKIGETAAITFTFSEDPGSSFADGDITTTGGTLSAISGTGLTRSAVFTPTPGMASGNASITVANATYTDAAGNTGGAGTTPSIRIDTVAPTLAISSDVSTLKAGETATITFTFSEDPGSSFFWDGSTGNVAVSGGSLSAISGRDLTRTATFTPTPDLASGSASIAVAASSYTDTAGNNGAAGTTPTISIDTVAPTLAITSNVSAVKSGETATITFTFSEDPGSSFAAGDISTTGGMLGAISDSGLTRTATFTPTPGLASGNASITVAARSYTDAVGNGGAAGTTPAISIDTLAPTLAITSDVSALKAGETATIVFTFSEDPGSSFDWDGSVGDVVVSGGSLSAISGSGLLRVAGFTPTPGLASGSASITVASATYTDAAGNTGSAGTMPSISIDTLVPTLAITSNVSAVKAGETAAITFTFSEDPGSSFADGDISTTGGTLSAISGTGLTRSATFTPTPGLASGNASITVAASSYTDTAGNAGAAGTTPTIAMDTLVPTLAITASYNGHDVTSMKVDDFTWITFTFSEDPGNSFTADDITTTGGTLSAIWGSGLLRYAGFTPTPDLDSGNGSFTVAAGSYADAAGNAGGAGSSPSISIDTRKPTAVITSDRSVLKIGETATITITFSEDPGSTFVWDGNQGQAVVSAKGGYRLLDGTLSDVYVVGGTLGAISGSGLIRTATFTPAPFYDNGSNDPYFSVTGFSDAAGNATYHGGLLLNRITIDTLAPTATVESAVFTSASHTLVLTGSNFSSLLGSSQSHMEGNVNVPGENASTDIKARLDWSKLSWDINGDNATTPDVSFSLSDIASARVTDSTHLTVVLTDAKATALISTSGFGGNPVMDALDIAAGFAVDQHGNVASNDARANVPLTAVVPVAGASVIDLGAYGKLMNGVQVDGGSWYYVWDRNGDGSITSADQTTHDVLDVIFNQDAYGVANTTVANADGLYGSTDVYHYASIGGVQLSLPTMGGGVSTPYGPNGLNYYQQYSTVTGNQSNPKYDDLLAVWDAFNDYPVSMDSRPTGWVVSGSYWSSTPTPKGHADLWFGGGWTYDNVEATLYYVALQVISSGPPKIVITDDEAGIGNIAGGDILYTFTFDQNVTGFQASDITVANGSQGDFTENSTSVYTLVVTPDPGFSGNVTVDVPAAVVIDSLGRGNIAAAQSVQAVDMLAPTVTGLALSSPKAGVLKAGDVVVLTATVSEATTVTGSPQIELNIGGSAVLASYVSGNRSTALVFGYVIQAGQTDSNGISVTSSDLQLNGGSLTDAAGNALTLTHNAVADDAGHTVDTTAPTAPTAVTLTAAGGTVKPYYINASNTSLTAVATIVAGEATGGSALLQIGGVTVAIDNSIAAGDTSVSFTTSDGTPTNAELQAAIASEGIATVVLMDAAGNATTSSVNNPPLLRDMTAPTVSGIAISGATGAQNNWFNTGDVLSLVVTMSEATSVTGTPQLELDIGGTAVLANYVSGSGSTSLVFSYTIQAGLSDSNGISVTSSDLQLNGGTLRDANGNAATLSHSALADNSGYRIDALAPSAPTIDAVATDNVINGAEASLAELRGPWSMTNTATSITGTNEPGCTVVLTFGSTYREAYVEYKWGGSGWVGGNTWIYTLVTDDIAAMGQGAETLSVTQTDAAGNTSSATRSISIDTLAPTAPTAVTLTPAGGTVLPNTITLSNTSLTASATIVAGEATGGSARLLINGATVATDNSIAAGDTSVSFTTSDGTPTNAELQAAIASGGVATVVLMDAVGNAATSSVNNPTLVRDMTSPTVSGIAISGSTGAKHGPLNSLNAGDVLSLVVTMSVATTVTGTPQLELDIGGTAVLANYVSGSGSTSLVFNYTIQTGQTDSNGISVAANKLTLNGGTLQGAVGNAAMLTHSALADNANYVVDNTAPLISSIALTGGNGGVLNVGDVVHITVTLNEAVDFGQTLAWKDPGSGNYLFSLQYPQLALKIGDTVVVADCDYIPGSTFNTTTLSFKYTIEHGQNDANGISIPANALTLHGGYINDLAGNPATLAYSAVGDNASYRVNSAAPTVRSVAISSASGISNGFLNAGDVVSITVTMSEAVTVTGTPQLYLSGPGVANYVSGSGTTSLVFNYTIQAGQNVPDGISIGAKMYLNGGALTGSNGNLALDDWWNPSWLTTPGAAPNAGYRVDTTAPTVLGGYLTGATGIDLNDPAAAPVVLRAGDVVNFTVVMSEATVVTGTPHYELNIGNSAVQASYASGSGSKDLIFNYTILTGQSDADGINFSTNKLTLNGGTLTDLAGNAATLQMNNNVAVSANPFLKVDAIAPVFSSSSAASFSEATGGPAYDATADNDVGVSYTLSGPDAALFYLNDDYYHHGLVTFNSQPDYEQPHDSNADNVYNLTVTATDNVGNATSQAVAITVTNGADPIHLGAQTLFMPWTNMGETLICNTAPLMSDAGGMHAYLNSLRDSGNIASVPLATVASWFGLVDYSIEVPPAIMEIVHLDLVAPVTMSNGKTYYLMNSTVEYWQYTHHQNMKWDPQYYLDSTDFTWHWGEWIKDGPGWDSWDLAYTQTSPVLSHEQLDFLMGGPVHWANWPTPSATEGPLWQRALAQYLHGIPPVFDDTLTSWVEDTVNTQPSGAVAGVDDARSVILEGHTLVLPTASELQALLNDNPWFNHPPAGWGGLNQVFWSATQSGENSHQTVELWGPGAVTTEPDRMFFPVVFQVL